MMVKTQEMTEKRGKWLCIKQDTEVVKMVKEKNLYTQKRDRKGERGQSRFLLS